MPEAVLELVDVVKNYGKTQALSSITLDLPSGRLVGLMGAGEIDASAILDLAPIAEAAPAPTPPANADAPLKEKT